MSKNNYSNGLQSTTGSASEQESFFSVCELANSLHDNQSLFLKLTDECSAAIKQAIKLRSVIRMHIRKQEAEIEIGGHDATSTIFKCSLQNQPETDSICFDPKENLYSNIGPAIKTKFQVQATSKAFSDLKEKTQKLVEAEQQKKAKDMPKSPRKNKFVSSEAPRQIKTNNSFLAKFSNKRTHSPSPVSTIRKMTNALSVPAKQKPTEANKNQIQQMRMVKNETQEKFDERRGKLSGNEAKAAPKTNVLQTLTSAEIVPDVKKSAKVMGISQPVKGLFYAPTRKSLHGAPSVSPVSTATSTPKTISPPLIARPASVDSTLQHSSSCSPEDSIGPMAISTKPSRDWAQEFALIGSQDDAIRYHSIFKNDYPEYRRYYDELTRVADEFLSLKSDLMKTNDDQGIQTVEKQIREKLSNLQNDQQFMFKRQRHTDLHAKLNAIKKALEEWGKRVESDL